MIAPTWPPVETKPTTMAPEWPPKQATAQMAPTWPPTATVAGTGEAAIVSPISNEAGAGAGAVRAPMQIVEDFNDHMGALANTAMASVADTTTMPMKLAGRLLTGTNNNNFNSAVQETYNDIDNKYRKDAETYPELPALRLAGSLATYYMLGKITGGKSALTSLTLKGGDAGSKMAGLIGKGLDAVGISGSLFSKVGEVGGRIIGSAIGAIPGGVLTGGMLNDSRQGNNWWNKDAAQTGGYMSAVTGPLASGTNQYMKGLDKYQTENIAPKVLTSARATEALNQVKNIQGGLEKFSLVKLPLKALDALMQYSPAKWSLMHLNQIMQPGNDNPQMVQYLFNKAAQNLGKVGIVAATQTYGKLQNDKRDSQMEKK